jgi:hypothetical protein
VEPRHRASWACFINYDAKKRLQNQEKNAVNMSLKFTPEHEKNYKELSTSAAVALSEIKGKDLVSNFVQSRSSFCTAVACLGLCAVEIKFLHGCSVPWASLKQEKHSAPAGDSSVSAPTPPGSPRIEGSQAAAALSIGKAKGESEGNSTHEDEGEDKSNAYGEDDYRGGDRVVHFREEFDPKNPLEIDCSETTILSQSTLSHVSVRRTQLPPCFTSTMIWLPSFLFSTAQSTKDGWLITNAPFISMISCHHHHHGTIFTKNGRQSASGKGRKPPGICPGVTTIVAPKSVGSRTTNGQMKAIS